MRIKRSNETPQDPLLKAFETLWTSLLTTPVHLDSALSKLPPASKSALAQFLPLLLRTPASLCEGQGIGIPSGEPWKLTSAQLVNWRPAHLAAARFAELRNSGVPYPGFRVEAQAADYPSWLLDDWRAQGGSQMADALVERLGSEAPLSLRARRAIGAEELLRRLKEADLPVRAAVSKIAPWGVVLAGYAPILNSELYKEGCFEIQDEGSQLMALFALWPELFGAALQSRPGMDPAHDLSAIEVPEKVPSWTVVDACAGAGGKTLALADALHGKGRIFAYDTSAAKVNALRRRVSREQLTNIQALAVTEGKEKEQIGKFRRRADVVLVDAPCSGWGVLRRNPDIKWRQAESARTRMPELQKRILDTYSDLVAPGGRLVYGVCTFRKAETEGVVVDFLESHPDFEPTHGGYLGPASCDGFFMQAFRRARKGVGAGGAGASE